MKHLAISYAYSNEKDIHGNVDTVFLKNYIERIADILQQKSNVEKVRHSLLPLEDQHIEEHIRNNNTIASEKKYQASLDYCKQRILDETVDTIMFILKYPLDTTKMDAIEPQESGGMKQELQMALGKDPDPQFIPEKNISRIIAIQEGLEDYARTEKYTTGVSSIIRFHHLSDLYTQIKHLQI